MRLSAVLGQQHLVTVLQRLNARQRLPQTLLFEGRPGTGRQTLALALAQAFLCSDLQAGDACGACESCRLLEAGAHPDCTVLPHETQAAEIPVAQVRDEVISRARESALMSQGRVFIIPGVERLRPEAANALLKVLEEPSPGSCFIMTCRQRQGILATIRSRSQCFRLQELTQEALTQVLQQQGCDTAQAARLAQLGQGSHRGLLDRGGVQTPAAPLAELQALLRDFDIEVVSSICEQLPQSVPESLDMTLSAWRREVCQRWLLQLQQILRQQLREDPREAVVEQIEALRALQRDLRLNIDPRLVIEGLSLV